MKNIQVIDGADNCAYSIYRISDEVFFEIFNGEGQDIAFVEDLFYRLGEMKASEVLAKCWSRLVEKQDVVGIHGTLFFQLEFKRTFYPNLKEKDLDDLRARPVIQRKVGTKQRQTRDKRSGR